MEERRVIEEGLTGNESVIISGLLRAFPGKPVTPVKEGQPAAQAPSTSSPKGKPGTNGK